MHLMKRIRRLSAMLPPRLPPMPDIDPEWQQLAARDPVARAHALALRQRRLALWPDREPDTDDLFNDEVCFRHVIWLNSTSHGGLSEWLNPLLYEPAHSPVEHQRPLASATQPGSPARVGEYLGQRGDRALSRTRR